MNSVNTSTLQNVMAGHPGVAFPRWSGGRLAHLTALILAAVVSPWTAAATGQDAAAQRAAGRRVVALNTEWRFHAGDIPGAARPEFRDLSWERIDLPHTWNAADGQDGGGDYRRGVGWYRHAFRINPDESGRRVFVRFGAANTVARVFVDGEAIGSHRGGFAAFCYEITSRVRPGARHLLAVEVSNARQDDVPPWSADFTFFGGLYRGAHLLITDPLCISPLDHGSPGVYITQVSLTDDRAVVDVRTLVANGRNADAAPLVETRVLSADGVVVASAQMARPVTSGKTVEARQQLVIETPRRWRGRQDPYLYSVVVRILDGERVTDQVVQPLGLRTFKVDPDRGFFLNGEPLELRGVNRHQDRLDMGWALSRSEHEEDLALIRELGCTALRLAHYQHDGYVYDLCDRVGLIVWAEIPLVNRIVEGPAFAANCRRQLVELVPQNFNHPSICFWGVHNEITASWEPGPDPSDLIRELADVVRREDPGRLSVCAATDPVDHPANWHTDLTAFNRYFGWYGGAADGLGTWLDVVHAARPSRPIGIAEYGAGASVIHHELPAKQPRHDGPWHPEEWQASVHEAQWLALKERSYIWCKLLWNMFDFASDGRAEGDQPGRNDKGLVTYDRRVKKDAFYWYKSQWSDEPVVHITSRRFEPRTSPETEVKVYANCEHVELNVNQASLGRRSAGDGIFRWPAVRLQPGENTVEAVGWRDGVEYRDRCRWTLVDPDPGAADPARWNDAIRRFEKWDGKNSAPADAVLFVGSSSIRGWATGDDFPRLAVINRGFGGSHISDCTHFADRIVLPYQPEVVVMYAGDNDIAAGKTPRQVLDDYGEFVRVVHAAQPATPIVFISIKPSLARWSMWPQMKEANLLIRDFCRRDSRLLFVDTATPMLRSDGRPRGELLQPDGLHLTPDGYRLWTRLLSPAIDQARKARQE